MSLPRNEWFPDDPDQLPPARRRRAQRLIVPLDLDEQAAFLDRLVQRASPSIDFFLFSLLSGIVLGMSLLLDQPGLMVLGLLVAPLMSPVVGAALGTMIGSLPLFIKSLAALFIGTFFVLVGGMFTGYVSQYWFPGVETLFMQGQVHTRLSWIYAAVLGIGAVMTAGVLARKSEDRARLPNIALAYGLYVPVVAAGFGLVARGGPQGDLPTLGLAYLWPDGLVVFGLHLAVAVGVGALTLGILGYRPPTLVGYTLWGALALLFLVALVGVSSFGVAVGGQVAIPTFTSTPMPTATMTWTPTATPIPPTETPTLTITPSPIPPTATWTPSPVPPTLTPAPVFAVVSADGDTGARIRVTPGGTTLGLLRNGTTVQLLEPPREIDGEIWMHILTAEGVEGWMFSAVLTIATPAPDWTP